MFEHDKFPLKEDIFVEDLSQAMVTKYGTLAHENPPRAADETTPKNRRHCFWDTLHCSFGVRW